CFFFSSRRRHTRSKRDWSSDVCSSDLGELAHEVGDAGLHGVAVVLEVAASLLVQFRGELRLVVGGTLAQLALVLLDAEDLRLHEIGRASCRESMTTHERRWSCNR